MHLTAEGVPDCKPDNPMMASMLCIPAQLNGGALMKATCTSQSSDVESFVWCNAVMEDLLNVFMGFEGKYIRASRASSQAGSPITFRIHGQLEHSLQELANRMLPVGWVTDATCTCACVFHTRTCQNKASSHPGSPLTFSI